MQQAEQGKVLVMGAGWVGSAIIRWFTEQGLTPLVYDPPKGLGGKSELDAAEIVFICVPTPFDPAKGGFDLSYVESAISALPDGKIVVIKSTVLPGTTDAMQERFPRHVILFNPEFLRQATAYDDFVKPDRQIVGAAAGREAEARRVLSILPSAPFVRVVAPKVAETTKYFGNCFLALKVVFANQLFDLCDAIDTDYDAVRDCAAADPRIGPGHLQVLHEGYRGYSGTCFPKDMRALIQLGDSAGAPQELLRLAEQLNTALIEKNPKRP